MSFIKEVTYDSILKVFLKSYGTKDNWIRSYGGEVVIKEEDVDQKLQKSGEVTVKFSRELKLPRELIQKWDPTFRENVPSLELSSKDKDQIQKEFEE